MSNGSRNIVFRALRGVFRTIAPSSLIEAQRGFRGLLAAGGLRHAVRVTAGLYFGRYRCAICKRRVQAFTPIDPTDLETARSHGWIYTPADAETCNAHSYTCPHCAASDRDRLYALHMTRYFSSIRPNRALKVVDFAPTLPLSRFTRELVGRLPYSVSYVTADLFMDGVDDKVDIMDMAIYDDCSVDFFICSHVLEHVDDDKKALKELYRILKPKGQGILVVPIILTVADIDEDPSVTDHGERWRRFGQFDHVRLYSKQGFISRVEEAGFAIHVLGSQHFGEATFRDHGITSQSILYVVEKK